MKRSCLAVFLCLFIPVAASATPITVSTSASFSNVSVSSGGSVPYTATATSIAWDSGALLTTSGIGSRQVSDTTPIVLANLYWTSGSNADKTYDVKALWDVVLTLAPPTTNAPKAMSIAVLDKKQSNQDDILTLGSPTQTLTFDGWTIGNFRYLVDGAPLRDNTLSLSDRDDEEIQLVADFTAPTAPAPPAVPEPASMVLLGTGLVGLGGAARRRLRK